MRLTVKTTLSCAHKLSCFGEDSPCNRLHGHTYYVEICIIGGISKGKEFLIDYDKVVKCVKGAFDHRYLNDRFKELDLDGEPTLENLTQGVYDVVSSLVGKSYIRVQEEHISVQSVKIQEGDGSTMEYYA